MLSKLHYFYVFVAANCAFVLINAESQRFDQRNQIAVIVPMRNREEHLQILLDRYVTFANKYKNNLIIVVAEQDDKERYNLGKSRNVGFLEAKKFNPSHVIFSDVDIWPKSDAAWKEMMFAPDKRICKHFYYYIASIGGLFSFLVDDFLKTNGFPNNFVGWGGEDDIFAQRTKNVCISRWLYHEGDFRSKQKRSFDVEDDTPRDFNEDRFAMIEKSRENHTGLSDLSYSINKQIECLLSPFVTYRHIWFQ